MMRVDVDFNERDRDGRVVTRVPDADRLTTGQKVYLYDPPERLWAEAVVARVNGSTNIAAFDVDWSSFMDADLVAITDARGQWSIQVPATGMPHPTFARAESHATTWRMAVARWRWEPASGAASSCNLSGVPLSSRRRAAAQ